MPAKKPKPVKKLFALPHGYTLAMWRSTPAMSDEFGKMLKERLLSSVIAVLVNQIPSGFPLRGQAVNDTQANIELGRINGYIECLNLLQLLGQTVEKSEPIEETYERTNGNNND